MNKEVIFNFLKKNNIGHKPDWSGRYVVVEKIDLLKFLVAKSSDKDIRDTSSEILDEIHLSEEDTYYLSVEWNNPFNCYPTFAEIVTQSFTWDDTDKGSDYWSEMYDKFGSRNVLIWEDILNCFRSAYPDE